MDKFLKFLKLVSCTTVKEIEDETEEILKVFDSRLSQLSSFEQQLLLSEDYPRWPLIVKIRSCKSDLRFLRMFACSFSSLDNTVAEIIHILIPDSADSEDGIPPDSVDRINRWVFNLQHKIQICKRKFEVLHNSFRCNPLRNSSTMEFLAAILQNLKDLLHNSFRCNPLRNSSTMEFLAAILQNLKDLYMHKTRDEIHLLKNQIASLEEKVTLLHNLFIVIPNQWGNFAFNVAVNVFAQNSASLVFLYWVKAVDEDTATQLNLLLFDVLQKYIPCVPAFKAVYIEFLDEMKSRQFDSLLSGQIVQSFLDLLLDNLTVHTSKEDFQIFREYLFFVVSFLVNPPDHHLEDQELMMLTAEMDLLVKQDLFRVLSVYDKNGNSSEANACLGDSMRKAEQVKGKIQLFYERTRDSFSYDFPKINGLGFFDFLLQNLSFLTEKLKSDTNFAKHLIIQIEEELMSLRPYLDDLLKGQKEDKELKDPWLNVIDLAYKTEYAINSCSVDGDPLWYNMARLIEVLKKLKDANSSIKKVEGKKRLGGATLHSSEVASNRSPEGPSASSFNEAMVGLEEEAEKIIGNLKNGSKSLEIVAIVGMPGLGKTTMANKVYNAPAVRNYFHVLAYCIVSQVYSTRKILLDILGDIRGKDDKMYNMTEEDLADMLRKCLLGVRYLIVMDDIWDVKSWVEIRRSLPDKQNGSRVIFTTRNCDVALQANESCILHPLRFLSDEESWELLRKKAFQSEEDCPPDFLEVGKRIAKKCKGLPLTVILIGGLLRTERSQRWWSEISEAFSTYVLTEDVMSVLEYSYQHLPENLKPCFLYFGAFVEDKLIRVSKLMLLWIAEGFVLNSKQENLENVARKYLNDLVDRSLVIVDERSSYGGIKSCRTHDLVHEFCQRKAQEESLFQLKVNHEVSGSSSSNLSNPYRLCIHAKGSEFDTRNICPSIRSLLGFNLKYYDDEFYDFSNLKLVQVIDVEGFRDSRVHPGFVSLMGQNLTLASGVHLRFMSFSFEDRIILPNDFLSNHLNLEILIGATFGEILPEAFWNLTRLRHVHVPMCPLSEAYPRSHPQMANLESFSWLSVSSTEELEVFLQRSPSLRKLCLYCSESGESSESSDYKQKIHFPKLDSLTRLESLNVEGVGEACLRSFNLLSSLKKLSLGLCYLDWRYVSLISKMPCLEVLKLRQFSFDGPKWDMEDTEFPKLKFLKLQFLELAEWIACRESFPLLEVLNVEYCFELETIPACFGEIPTLKRIEVDGSSKSFADSVVEIQEAQKDFGNEELQVLINNNKIISGH